MTRSISYLIGIFLLTLFAAVIGAALAIDYLLKRFEKPQNTRPFQPTEEASKKKVQSSTDSSYISTKLEELNSISLKIKNLPTENFFRQRYLQRTFYTPCQKRFKLNYQGYCWIPEEFYADWQESQLFQASEFNIHHTIINLFQ